MKTCLVLEGGAMRGMYTAGALDVFYNAGIQFDGIIGVSAGAAFGVNYLSRQPGPGDPLQQALQRRPSLHGADPPAENRQHRRHGIRL